MTKLGKILFLILILGLISLGVYVDKKHREAQAARVALSATVANTPARAADDSELQKDLGTALPYPRRLPAAAEYVVKDSTLTIELSEWVGYCGLIAYNGGLEPNPNSAFTKDTGLLLKLTVSEEETWDRLVTGKLAGSSTTVDVLAVYGKQLNVIVPAQFDFSRGADALLVRTDISRINDLAGKIVSCCQFTESDFLLRDLAREAGLEVNVLPDLGAAPDPMKINVFVTDEGGKAGDALLHDIKGNINKLAGCMTWSPKTEEVVAGSEGKARILTTNRNLLLIADVLVLNKPFAQKNAAAVKGLSTAVIEGNRMVDADPSKYAPVIEKAFHWKPGQFADEYKKVHLSNLPENLAFFSGTIDSAGSFPGIYQMAVLSYGPGIIRDDSTSETLMDTAGLLALDKSGRYAQQKVTLSPIKIGSSGQSLEQNPLLSKNIHFDFEPNSSVLHASEHNTQNYEDIRSLLKLSPGSTIMLRGHVDDAQIDTFRQRGGQPFVDEMALKAMQLSKDRAESVEKELLTQGVDTSLITVIGKGWEEPIAKSLPTDSDDVRQQKSSKNRRVEAVWITIE